MATRKVLISICITVPKEYPGSPQSMAKKFNHKNILVGLEDIAYDHRLPHTTSKAILWKYISGMYGRPQNRASGQSIHQLIFCMKYFCELANDLGQSSTQHMVYLMTPEQYYHPSGFLPLQLLRHRLEGVLAQMLS